MDPFEGFEITPELKQELDKAIDKKIESALKKIHEKFPDEELEKYRQLLTDVFKEGKSPKEAMGFSDAFIEALYASACQTFNGGDYDGAMPIFRLLMEMDPEKPRYVAALASCYFRKKEWEKALSMYVIASLCAPDDPMPFFYAAECYIQMNQLLEATFFLRGTIRRAERDPKLEPIARRAQLTMDGIYKILRGEKLEA